MSKVTVKGYQRAKPKPRATGYAKGGLALLPGVAVPQDGEMTEPQQAYQSRVESFNHEQNWRKGHQLTNLQRERVEGARGALVAEGQGLAQVQAPGQVQEEEPLRRPPPMPQEDEAYPMAFAPRQGPRSWGPLNLGGENDPVRDGGFGGLAAGLNSSIGDLGGRYARGGAIDYRQGGPVAGGPPGRDTVPVVAKPGGPVKAMLDNGEYVLPKPTVAAVGKPGLDALVVKTTGQKPVGYGQPQGYAQGGMTELEKERMRLIDPRTAIARAAPTPTAPMQFRPPMSGGNLVAGASVPGMPSEGQMAQERMRAIDPRTAVAVPAGSPITVRDAATRVPSASKAAPHAETQVDTGVPVVPSESDISALRANNPGLIQAVREHSGRVLGDIWNAPSVGYGLGATARHIKDGAVTTGTAIGEGAAQLALDTSAGFSSGFSGEPSQKQVASQPRPGQVKAPPSAAAQPDPGLRGLAPVASPADQGSIMDPNTPFQKVPGAYKPGLDFAPGFTKTTTPGQPGATYSGPQGSLQYEGPGTGGASPLGLDRATMTAANANMRRGGGGGSFRVVGGAPQGVSEAEYAAMDPAQKSAAKVASLNAQAQSIRELRNARREAEGLPPVGGYKAPPSVADKRLAFDQENAKANRDQTLGLEKLKTELGLSKDQAEKAQQWDNDFGKAWDAFKPAESVGASAGVSPAGRAWGLKTGAMLKQQFPGLTPNAAAGHLYALAAMIPDEAQAMAQALAEGMGEAEARAAARAAVQDAQARAEAGLQALLYQPAQKAAG